MQIDVVRDLAALRVLEADWRRVYAEDPEAHFFLSWPWLSKRLERRAGWSVLVARPGPDAPPVAFFPIKQRTQTDRRGRSFGEITLPGRGAADYTGFLCLPEHEVRVGLTFAAYLLGLDWQVMSLECVRASERRMSGLLDAFAAARLTVEREPIMMGGVDNSRCPYADLPGDWDAYLAQLSANTRQKLRRYLRKVDGTTLRVTVAEPATFELHMNSLLTLWCARWGTQKRDRLELLLRSTREELSDAMGNGSLYLPVLWRGETPIAALASMLDAEKRHVLVELGARDMAFEELSPGTILHAHSIRWASERGFVRYDFLRGNEPYKYAFATGERQIESLVVRRGRALEATERAPKKRAAQAAASAATLLADTCSAIATQPDAQAAIA